MDSLIAALPAIPDLDLMVCAEAGVAYQRDMSTLVKYDSSYFDKCRSYEGAEIAEAINRGRIEMVARHFSPVSRVLDIGVGSGEFIKRRPNTYGYDVNPAAESWLKGCDKWVEPRDFGHFWAFSMWDVLEHLPTPTDYLDRMEHGSRLFLSIPIFADLATIRASRHYRPGEHLYYFTETGLIRWLGGRGFELLDQQDFETRAGRDSILSFAFEKK